MGGGGAHAVRACCVCRFTGIIFLEGNEKYCCVCPFIYYSVQIIYTSSRHNILCRDVPFSMFAGSLKEENKFEKNNVEKTWRMSRTDRKKSEKRIAVERKKMKKEKKKILIKV